MAPHSTPVPHPPHPLSVRVGYKLDGYTPICQRSSSLFRRPGSLTRILGGNHRILPSARRNIRSNSVLHFGLHREEADLHLVDVAVRMGAHPNRLQYEPLWRILLENDAGLLLGLCNSD
jgi:hypothetical protein